MPDPHIRIIPHRPKGIADTGSFEVLTPAGSVYFHWDDNASRRAVSMSVTLTQEQAKRQAQEFARSAARKP